jgi:hypothetical protein
LRYVEVPGGWNVIKRQKKYCLIKKETREEVVDKMRSDGNDSTLTKDRDIMLKRTWWYHDIKLR